MSDVSMWPIVKGDYIVGSLDNPVAVAIIGGGNLELSPDIFAIKGTVKTENLGIEKIIANIVSNPRIRFLIVCGDEEYGHLPGNALLCLCNNDIDLDRRIIGTKAAIPFLCNVTREQIDRFRKQVEVIDLMHLKEAVQSREYAPSYEIEASNHILIMEVISDLIARDPGRYPGMPIVYAAKELREEGSSISKKVNQTADSITNQMLRMPSEQLSIFSESVVISDEFNVILEPVDGEVKIVLSVPLMRRLKLYLWRKDSV